MMKHSRFKGTFCILLFVAVLPLFSACTVIRDWVNRNNEPPSEGLTSSTDQQNKIMTQQEAIDAVVTALTMVLSNEAANTGVLPLLRSDNSRFCHTVLTRLLADRTCSTSDDAAVSTYTLSISGKEVFLQNKWIVQATLSLKNPEKKLIYQLQVSYPVGAV